MPEVLSSSIFSAGKVAFMPGTIDVDRNLLFAVIALQDDLIDQTQFTDVCAGWAMRMEQPLAGLLIERGWITKQDREDVERKIERKLKKHRGDVRATLGAVADGETRDVMQVVADPRVRQSLNGLPPARGHVLVETLVPPASQRDSIRYTLTRLHAEGGLGKIWVAHDTDLNRDVALKEIKPTTTLSADSEHRFLKEAQITGQLEHPNIVPVYELARRKEDDQPFYTMRFVRGQTLRDAIAEFHRQRAGKPAERLELQRQLLEPFIKVCQAVSYAHSKGVIHRDLKPENVVLGGHGEVVVLDWGLAKIIGQPDDEIPELNEPGISVSSDAQAVKTEGQVGTPAYMAPEQVEARHGLVDTKTDVYGLGAILFEILTGQPPASGQTIGEVFSKIQAGNLPRARELDPTIPRPLEAICSKALSHRRENRYARAEDPAEDVRRWLVDEPVSVYHDPISVRLLRWGRHHRTLVASLVALLLTSVVALSAGVVVVDRERRQTDRQRKIAYKQKTIADEQKTIAVANAAQALQNLRLAQNAADGLLGEVADVDLADIPQMEPVRRRLLEKARIDYQQFLAQKGDDPMVRWGSERSVVRLAEIQALLGDGPKAETSYRHAIDELSGLVKLDSANVDFRRDLARAYHGLGVALKDADRFEQADSALRQAVRLRDELAQGSNRSEEDRQAMADSQYQLAALLARRGAGRTEENAYAGAIEVQQGLVRQHGDRPEFRTRLARYRNNVAMLQNAAGHPEDAEKTLRTTIELLAPSIQGPEALPGPRWQLARASNNLGALLLGQRPEEARTQLGHARAVLAKLNAEFPAITQYSVELSSVEYNLGLLAQRAGKHDESVASFKASARLLESLRTRFPETPAYLFKLAMADVAISESLAKTAPAQAESALRKALDEQAAVLIKFPDVPDYKSIVGRGRYQLARLLLMQNAFKSQPAEAVHQAEEAVRLLTQVLASRPLSDTDQRSLGEAHHVLTLALIEAGRIPDAVATASKIPTTRPADPAAYVRAAALLIACANASPSTELGRLQAEAILAQAVGIVRDAVRARAIRLPATLEAPDLRPLRDRDDFKSLRDSLAQSPHAG
jgi:serine/threonine protein kinase/tetratricopeptide (TPR) repeat protein